MKLFFVSLGCDKNRVDAERMLGTIIDAGHEITDDEEQAEAVIVNTCCFIDAAKEESIGEILTYAGMKARGLIKALIVTGCMAQRYSTEIKKEIPEVDAVVTLSANAEIARILEEVNSGKKRPENCVYTGRGKDAPPNKGRRVITTGMGYEFLKIAEGCDRHCTYCAIPGIRGRYVSTPMDELVAEAKKLSEEGISELILVAQECTRYGTDLTGKKQLPELLKRLCAIEGLRWIRVLYCYPEEIDDELIDVIASEKKLCKYMDIPIQSGSDRILARMGRKIRTADIRALVEKLRSRIPGICIRTTLITGFPGETAADYRATADLVRELRFDRLGVFTYSQEEGTPAAGFPDQVPERTKKIRRTRLMKLQQELVIEKNRELTGETVDAVIEGRVTGAASRDGIGDVYAARTMRDAPDVDGLLFIEGVSPDRNMVTGDHVKVLITGADGYDLTGELCDEDESA